MIGKLLLLIFVAHSCPRHVQGRTQTKILRGRMSKTPLHNFGKHKNAQKDCAEGAKIFRFLLAEFQVLLPPPWYATEWYTKSRIKHSLTHQLDIIHVCNILVPENYDIMLPSQNSSRFQVDFWGKKFSSRRIKNQVVFKYFSSM